MPGIEIKGRSKIANYRHGGRIGLGKGSRRTKRQAAASEIFRAKALEKAGKIGPGAGHPLNPFRIIAEGRSSGFSGYPQKSTYEKSLEKHKKKFPTLVENIKYNKKKDFKKVKPSPRHTQKRADGGRIGLKHGKVPFWKFWGGAQKKIEERKYKTIEGMKGSGLKITDEQKKYLETHKGKPKKEPVKEPVKEAQGGRIGLKKGSNKNWIQKAVNPKHKGFCTPMTKKTCTPRRKALARTFKKMGRARKGK